MFISNDLYNNINNNSNNNNNNNSNHINNIHHKNINNDNNNDDNNDDRFFGLLELDTSMKTIQKSAVLGTVHILRKVLSV